MKKNKDINIGNIVNLFIGVIGIVVILIGVIFNLNNCNDILVTIFMSIGTSILSTSIVTFITSYYLVKNSSVKEIIEKWKLVCIYKSKSEMNVSSNFYLEKCEKSIDIMAIGMSGFLSAQQTTLIELIKKGVDIRIISCNSKKYLAQREKDESISGLIESVGKFYKDVEILSNWVSQVKNDIKDAKLKIKYLPTYPAFSYLRIDNRIFWGPDLYLKQSQLCPAFEFLDSGTGFLEFQKNFDELWKSNMLTEQFEINDNGEN